MAEQAVHTWQYRPGEMVVATELPDDDTDHTQVHGLVQESITSELAGVRSGGVFHPAQQRTRPLLFRAPGRPPLAFLFYNLAEEPHDFVKQVITATHDNTMAALNPVRNRGLSPLGVMPHWLGSAQQEYSDGSPATFPRPIRPPANGRYQYRYTPISARMNFRADVERASEAHQVPVLILDTRPNWARAQEQVARFPSNVQLAELVELLGGVGLPEWHSVALDQCEHEALPLARGPGGSRGDQDISDHALFIAGLIHDLSPRAPIHMRPVLNRYGVGDLHLLLWVLADVLANKRLSDPLVINMSLGFAPKLEHLPWLWHGVEKANDPDYVPDVPIRGQSPSIASLRGNARQVEETARLLHIGLDRLSEYLLANNCLGVAAAGNDSLHRVLDGRPRLGPRIPARYHSVLGVAATINAASSPAAYSNIGDEYEFGDHIATFGGDVAENGEPRDGVIGVYSAETFPSGGGRSAAELRNETGWATWSGTSFATAIAAGLVAAFWTTRRAAGQDASAEQVLVEFNDTPDAYVPALRTPAIAMQGEWVKA